MDSPKTSAAPPADHGSIPPTRARVTSAGLRLLWRSLPAFTIAAIALYLIWPVPKGQMPLSADHNVHLGRAAMVYDKLVSGHLSGWSSNWFFGFPLAELYPPLGDYAIALVRLASLGSLTFQQCYALVFAAAYAFHTVVMVRISRRAGVHPAAGMLAGFLLLFDAGVLREGGWSYTVYYGVWLQPVACALLWWAMAETYPLVQRPELGAAWLRRAALPAVLFALAMLTHPIVLPTSAVMMALFVLFVGIRSEVGLGPVTLRAGVVLALGICLSLWWIGPLFAHRHWMATFGTLYSDLGTMLGSALEGHLAKRMASGVGYGILFGLLWSWIAGNRFARFTATASTVLWMMSTSDFFWTLRLDWIHEGFLHMQYQRFIICAKPGLFLCAGIAAVGLIESAWRIWESKARSRRAGIRMFVMCALGAGLLVWMMSASYGAADKHEVGEVQLKKLKDEKRADAFAKELDQFCEWSKAVWDEREEFFRFAYRTRRHSHMYMDVTVCNGAPAYKTGYMPGAVFVHRPEASGDEIMTHLRVKYTVGGKRHGRRSKPVVNFGKLYVFERELEEQVARIERGDGEVEVIVDDPDGEEYVEIEVSGAEEGSLLVFNIAGFPRWELTHDGEPVEWFEVPAVGKGEHATQADRKAGRWRRGKPGAHQGRAPILMAADAADGTWTLRYNHWTPIDKIGVAALAFALAVFGASVLARWVPPLDSSLQRAHHGTERVLRSRRLVIVLGAALVAIPAARYVRGFAREAERGIGWLRRGKAHEVYGISIKPLKVERLIGPALVVENDDDLEGPATITFAAVPVRPSIPGWYAIHDSHSGSKWKGTYDIRILARPTDDDGDWTELKRISVNKRIGEKEFELELDEFSDVEHVDLALEIEVKGSNPPMMGFDLDFEPEPEPEPEPEA